MTTLNRSELLFVYDAQDCNPNGNPIGDNRPRRDPDTGKGIITDVRLKRYLRDQLQDDGFDIYVKKIAGESRTRTTLIKDVLGGVSDAEDLEDIEDIGESFLEAATDVRYFGATLSFEASDDEEDEAFREALNSAFPNHYQGPVQFLPAKSLNEVEENEEYDSLTSVISTGEGNRQGGFDLDDKRIKYGIFPFYGLVDNHGAETTNLSAADVERLDTLCWRALKNQTTSRSKLGQEPRLYLRVEYAEDDYHIGGLQNLLDLDGGDNLLRSISDVVLDVSDLLSTLDKNRDRIETIHLIADDRMTLDTGDEAISGDQLATELDSRGLDVHEIDVVDERDLAR
ncbi:type I-B CRISPR-associated protein Cas7/Csh2 [Haloarcula marismortui]|uniref:CRISPR-associated protein, Csh2 family n=1 Tax=Haloarcula marismortui ATCC 33800 TaxID=662476 RepID=M0JKD2_9EURY|nr:type I-B CRISPR-associated protein Cas7/Csh2 [Haloarcula sinaiiensis]EMA08150.1 CRISPR-associated protein, Csh2 family [Haloarcula sinaiiensis ATCC 33800]QUJ73984.1 type I-B CRISPR-associated protein Cas7/Csh2 [Haloarcula sinaiiensis ATCC 33800]